MHVVKIYYSFGISKLPFQQFQRTERMPCLIVEMQQIEAGGQSRERERMAAGGKMAYAPRTATQVGERIGGGTVDAKRDGFGGRIG